MEQANKANEDITDFAVNRYPNRVRANIKYALLRAFSLLSRSDELTGLYNHRHFYEHLEEEIEKTGKTNGTLSLVMADIDLFKIYNDTYGHSAGDKLLRRVGKCIALSIRGGDNAFRYGGGKFAIILPCADAKEALLVSEKIRKNVKNKLKTCAMPVTLSLGISVWPDNGELIEALVDAADFALLCAKENGRDCTFVSDNEIEPVDISSKEQMEKVRINVISALAATVEAKDRYTYGHCRKVSEYAISLAEDLNLSNRQKNVIWAAGLLHDIGKISIPDSILNKPGPLTTTEWKPVKSHPEVGVEILKYVSELQDCLPLILHHHERYDGKGYPAGLIGKDIPIGARILAIADAYDAMTTPRPYRGSMSWEQALAELAANSGEQFDRELAERFSRIIKSAKAPVY